MNSAAVKAIPQPKPHFLLGNALEIDAKASVESLMRLARDNGPIFRITAPGAEFIIVSSQALVNELCDETRFDKRVSRPLMLQRELIGPTLFTSRTEEPDWHRGHQAMQPGFGIAVLRTMFGSMADIAEQLLLKWERLEEGTPIDVADDMTRLTLDTIALCAFGYRLNSFYTNELHPFVRAMVRQFHETSERMRRPGFVTRLMIMTERQRREDSATMRGMSEMLLTRRRGLGPRTGQRDLLDLMLAARDPANGHGLSDAFIAGQLVGLLVAGHETTSGLLSFALYELVANPGVLARAVAEVDRVLGDEPPRFEHLAALPLIDQILKETLRIWPTAPIFSVYPYADTVIGDGYPIRQDQTVMVLLPMLHRDPKVWTDPEVFDPDRFAPDRLEALPPNAWKPFGNGQRSCIGRPFAMQESQLVLANILQRFDIALADPDYRLRIKQALTIKPDGFRLLVRRRDRTIRAHGPAAAAPVAATAPAAPPAASVAVGTAVQVLFGSNSGAAEAFAQRIANDAGARGYAARLAALDEAVGALSTAGLVVIVTASYEGHPTDNARAFVDWLGGLGPEALRGVRFAVFGCGHKDWARTYQAIPKRIDAGLAAAGAERCMERGEADARGDFFGDFDRWYEGFWQRAGSVLGGAPPEAAALPGLVVEFVDGARSLIIRQNQLALGQVVANRELVDTASPFGRSKRHVEIALPEGVTYRAGDYLAILPENPSEAVERALRRFDLPYDAQVVLHATAGLETVFPAAQPIMAGELLASYLDLGLPATRRAVTLLAEAAEDPAMKAALAALAGADYEAEVLARRVSLLDLLERFAGLPLAFAEFLQAVPALKPRQYSISSSPAWSPGHCSVTVAVLEAPAWSGSGRYQGVASSYLAHAKPGMRIAVTVRPSRAGFHLPEDPLVPIIMVGAGTGIAPFRGFVQERAIAAHHGQAFGPALLFFGCGHPEVDFLYRDELLAWEAEGVVSLHPAFHRAGEPEEHVQERLWAERAAIMPLMGQGARIFVCGDGAAMAPAVRETFGRIYREATGAAAEQVDAWLAELETSFRYSQDVFS